MSDSGNTNTSIDHNNTDLESLNNLRYVCLRQISDQLKNAVVDDQLQVFTILQSALDQYLPNPKFFTDNITVGEIEFLEEQSNFLKYYDTVGGFRLLCDLHQLVHETLELSHRVDEGIDPNTDLRHYRKLWQIKEAKQHRSGLLEYFIDRFKQNSFPADLFVADELRDSKREFLKDYRVEHQKVLAILETYTNHLLQ